MDGEEMSSRREKDGLKARDERVASMVRWLLDVEKGELVNATIPFDSACSRCSASSLDNQHNNVL